jgi:hypothetical protein
VILTSDISRLSASPASSTIIVDAFAPRRRSQHLIPRIQGPALKSGLDQRWSLSAGIDFRYLALTALLARCADGRFATCQACLAGLRSLSEEVSGLSWRPASGLDIA